METNEFIVALDRDSAAFVDACAVAGLAAPVPSCPGWNVADLLWQGHLGLMLDGTQAQKLLKIGTRQGVNDLVKRRRLLALPGPRGRALYPAFQFTNRGRPHAALPAILAHFERAGVHAHTIASWFKTPQARARC